MRRAGTFYDSSSESPSPPSRQQPQSAAASGLGPPLRVSGSSAAGAAAAAVGERSTNQQRLLMASSSESSLAASPLPVDKPGLAAVAEAFAPYCGGARCAAASPMAPSTSGSSSMLTPPSQRQPASWCGNGGPAATGAAGRAAACGGFPSVAHRLAAAAPLSASSSSASSSSAAAATGSGGPGNHGHGPGNHGGGPGNHGGSGGSSNGSGRGRGLCSRSLDAPRRVLAASAPAEASRFAAALDVSRSCNASLSAALSRLDEERAVGKEALAQARAREERLRLDLARRDAMAVAGAQQVRPLKSMIRALIHPSFWFCTLSLDASPSACLLACTDCGAPPGFASGPAPLFSGRCRRRGQRGRPRGRGPRGRGLRGGRARLQHEQ